MHGKWDMRRSHPRKKGKKMLERERERDRWKRTMLMLLEDCEADLQGIREVLEISERESKRHNERWWKGWWFGSAQKGWREWTMIYRRSNKNRNRGEGKTAVTPKYSSSIYPCFYAPPLCLSQPPFGLVLPHTLSLIAILTS